jgi:RND family efflux transporter MFP subunit
MSDRILIAGASVPVLSGVIALLLLQRVPGTPLAHAAAAMNTQSQLRAEVEAQATRGWVGVVVASNTAELAATTMGRVEKVFVRTGEAVKAGEPLIQFDRGESFSSVSMANAQLRQRDSELARTRARAQAADAQLSRLRAGERWLSKQEIDNAQAEVRVAQAELQAAQASVGLSRIALDQQRMRAGRQMLTAPFAGTVVALDVDRGDSVAAGQVVMRILSQERQVRFAFKPGELRGAREAVRIRLAGTDYAVRSHVSAVRPEVDPAAELVFATAPLPAAVPDATRWIPGATVTVSREE